MSSENDYGSYSEFKHYGPLDVLVERGHIWVIEASKTPRLILNVRLDRGLNIVFRLGPLTIYLDELMWRHKS